MKKNNRNNLGRRKGKLNKKNSYRKKLPKREPNLKRQVEWVTIKMRDSLNRRK